MKTITRTIYLFLFILVSYPLLIYLIPAFFGHHAEPVDHSLHKGPRNEVAGLIFLAAYALTLYLVIYMFWLIIMKYRVSNNEIASHNAWAQLMFIFVMGVLPALVAEFIIMAMVMGT